MSTPPPAANPAADPAATLRPLPPGTIVPVAGVSFHQDAVALTSIGDEVIIAHDQSNPFDVDAVSVSTTDGALLGHLPSRRGLNSRLLVHHRGGVWGGVIVDKLHGETIGLRIKIHTLLGHRPVGFGADAPGRRGPVEEPQVALETTPVTEPAPEQLVYAGSSGRLLGTLLDRDETRVRVQRENGSVTAYPLGVVRVGPATPAVAVAS